MKKLIVFDCDGVLRSASWEGIFRAYQEVCRYLGIDHTKFFRTVKEFRSWFNSDWRNNLIRLGVESEDKIPMINHIFHCVYDPYIKTFSWVSTVMEEIATAGENRIAVLSSSLSRSVRGSIIEAGASQYISLIVGYEHVEKIKPHPEGLEMIMEILDVSPYETWMVGDADADILAGKNAGTWTAAVSWGLTDSRKELVSLGAHMILENPEDILLL